MKILGMGLPEFIIILAVIVVVFFVFGPKNLPKLGASLGKTFRNFKDSVGSKKDKNLENEVQGEVVATESAASEPEETTFEKIGKKAGSAFESAKEIGSQVAAGASAAAAEMKAGAESVKQEAAAASQSAPAEQPAPAEQSAPAEQAAASAEQPAPAQAAAPAEAADVASDAAAAAEPRQAAEPTKRVVKRVVVKKTAE